MLQLKFIGFVLLSVLLSPTIPQAAESAANIRVKVKGMVCSFCVQGVEKKLLGIDGVKKVTVNLETKTVEMWLHQGKTVADRQIKDAIESAGYNIATITRPGPTTPKAPQAPPAGEQG